MKKVKSIVQLKPECKEYMEIQSQELRGKNIPNMDSYKLSAAEIAYDLKIMLTVIIGYAEISLFDLSKRNEIKDNLEEILDAADRLKKSARQLQAISQQ